MPWDGYTPLAIREKGSDPANTPIAALVVRGGELVASGVNRTKEGCDATAHAEIEALLKDAMSLRQDAGSLPRWGANP